MEKCLSQSLLNTNNSILYLNKTTNRKEFTNGRTLLDYMYSYKFGDESNRFKYLKNEYRLINNLIITNICRNIYPKITESTKSIIGKKTIQIKKFRKIKNSCFVPI